MVSLLLQACFLVSTLPPSRRGRHIQVQSPVTPSSFSGEIQIVTVCASGRT